MSEQVLLEAKAFIVCGELAPHVVLGVIVCEYSVPCWHMVIGVFLKIKGF